MKKFAFLKGGAALVALALVASPVLAGSLTVGGFVQELAKSMSLASSTPTEAAQALRSAGVSLPSIDMGKTLTQGDVVAIATAAGLTVRTSTPDAEFTEGQLSSFMVTFAPELGASAPEYGTDASDKPKTDPLTKGKGKKKGLIRSPSEPL